MAALVYISEEPESDLTFTVRLASLDTEEEVASIDVTAPQDAAPDPAFGPIALPIAIDFRGVLLPSVGRYALTVEYGGKILNEAPLQAELNQP